MKLNITPAGSGGGVTSITGTANQVIASASTGAITLSTPQSIATSSTPQFSTIGIGVAASTVSGINLLKSYTDPAASVQAMLVSSQLNALTANTALTFHGFNSDIRLDQGSSNSTSAFGVRGATSAAYGNGASGVITGVAGLVLQGGNLAAGTVTNFYGLVLATAVNAGGGAVTNVIGFDVSAQTVGGTSNIGFRSAIASSATGAYNLYMSGTAVNYLNGTVLFGTLTLPTSATYNMVLGGGTTSPVLGAATADIVSLSPVDKAAGDRRLYIQSELGTAISLGNDRLNFGAATGLISIAGTDIITSTATALTLSIATSVSERLTLTKHFLWDGGRYVTTQFDAAATTALATITGLSCTIESGKKYAFEAWMDANLAAAGGGKWAVSGTATHTTIGYNIKGENYSVPPTISMNARGTAKDTSHTVTGISGVYQVRIVGGTTCNAGGTFLLQFAQQTGSGTSSILVGSHFKVWEVQ